jgi:hypothetical protein
MLSFTFPPSSFLPFFCRPFFCKAPYFPALLFLLLLCRTAAGADPGTYRTGKLDPRVAGVPAAIQPAIFTNPDGMLKPLVNWLVRDAKDDFHKVKLIHDWIADNIDYDAEGFAAGKLPDASPKTTLARRKAVCQGYADLLQKMCAIAGLPCEVIAGYGRGANFRIGEAENVRKFDHAWNAVKIQKQWYLVDVCWDAGRVEGKTYRKQYGTSYLFADPRNFLYTHFPVLVKWQLLEAPLSVEQFVALPLLQGRFFESGLRLATPLQRLHPVGESVQLSIADPDDVVLMAGLVEPGKSGHDALPGRTLLRRSRTEINVLVTFPAAGHWGVEIYSKSRQDQGDYWQAATLEFDARAGTTWTMAKTHSSVEGIDSFLESPVYVPLAAGKEQEFKIRVRNAGKVQLRLGRQTWIPMPPAADDPELYRVTAAVPAEGLVRIVAQPRSGGSSWTLADFTPDQK